MVALLWFSAQDIAFSALLSVHDKTGQGGVMMNKIKTRLTVVFSFFVVCTGISHPQAYADTPEWYNGARVQIHTRMSLGKGDINSKSSIFWQLPEQVRRLGVTAFTRHIKGGHEGAWWPSSVGVMEFSY